MFVVYYLKLDVDGLKIFIFLPAVKAKRYVFNWYSDYITFCTFSRIKGKKPVVKFEPKFMDFVLETTVYCCKISCEKYPPSKEYDVKFCIDVPEQKTLTIPLKTVWEICNNGFCRFIIRNSVLFWIIASIVGVFKEKLGLLQI